MHILDDLKRMERLDRSNVRGSIAVLDQQIEQVVSDFKKVKIPSSYQSINKVVINGMGGSGLGGHIIKSLYSQDLKIPLEVVNGYSFPNYLDKNTLYLIFSYSGSTEEPLSTINAALKRNAKIFCVSKNKGKLANIAKFKKLPFFSFEEKFNPCRQPRMGLGYSFFSQLMLFNKLGIIKISKQENGKVIALIKKSVKKYNPLTPFKNNLAKKLASLIYGKIPIIVAAEHLRGNSHVLANQINENAKQLSFLFKIPEMNHHLLEGLKHPDINKNKLIFLLFNSRLYFERNQLRFGITKDVILKQSKAVTININSPTKLEQSFEMLMLGSYVSFYLAMLNNLDPSYIPWVDYFKKQLGKH